ncbi:unnamed protein product [Phytomonas sp. Hart1]|nr:unnamed protein product [Phytomonas sp. Hart1]|eukprot:CCW70691.1 unnamed protein product [Phytomonas sp. isolate Hart1]
MDAYTTPEYFHCITDSLFQKSVYEPEADTFLFLESLDREKSYLSRVISCKKDCCIVEVGCGSGVVITHLFALLQSIDLLNTPGSGDSIQNENQSSAIVLHHSGGDSTSQIPLNRRRFYAIDVNPLALQATAFTWDRTLKKYFWRDVEKFMVQDNSSQGSSGVEALTLDPNVVNLYTYPGKSEGVGERISSIETAAAGIYMDAKAPIKSSCASPVLWPYTLSLLEGDLLHALKDLQGPFRVRSCDVVLFNPPYVPTSTEELEQALTRKDLITSAWCGGERGRVVLDRFIEMLPHYLSRDGCCYIVLIKENDIADVYRKIQVEFHLYHHLTTCMDGNGSTLEDQPTESYHGEADLMHIVCCTDRYTGEHLSIHRISYKGSS